MPENDCYFLYLVNTRKHLSIFSDCGSLDMPKNGYIYYSSGTTYGSVAYYNCTEPYAVIGNSERMCEASGVWTSTDPFCRKIGTVLSIFFLSFKFIRVTAKANTALANMNDQKLYHCLASSTLNSTIKDPLN